MGAPRLLASFAASAHEVIRLPQILRMEPFHLGPVTQGGAAPLRPPPDIWSALLLLLRAGCCCCRAAVAAAAATGGLLLLQFVPSGRGFRGRREQEGRPDGSSTLKGHTGRARRGRRAGPGRLPKGSQPPRVPLTHTQHPRAEEGGGTHHPRGARDTGRGKEASTPGTTRTKLAWSLTRERRSGGGRNGRHDHRGAGGATRTATRPRGAHLHFSFLSYPFLGDRFHRFPGAGALRPRVPKVWIT